MAKTVPGILAQIEKLKSRLASEQNKAIPRIRREIANLGLTVEYLFGKVEAAVSALVTPTTKVAKVPKASGKPVSKVRFADGKGGTWSGHGKRPNWFIKALETQTKEQLETLGSKHVGVATAAPAAPTVGATTTSNAPVKKARSKPVKKVATAQAKTATDAVQAPKAPLKVAAKTGAKAPAPAKAPSKVAAKSPAKAITKPAAKTKATAKAKPAAAPAAATSNEAPATK